jgi:hypothetical protein
MERTFICYILVIEAASFGEEGPCMGAKLTAVSPMVIAEMTSPEMLPYSSTSSSTTDHIQIKAASSSAAGNTERIGVRLKSPVARAMPGDQNKLVSLTELAASRWVLLADASCKPFLRQLSQAKNV